METTTRTVAVARPLPTIAMTMGDPAGIGPEILVKAWSEPALHAICTPLAIGVPEVFRREIRTLGARMEVVEVSDAQAPAPSPALLRCLTFEDESLPVPYGASCAEGGRQSYLSIVRATELALKNEVAGIVTAPIHKHAWHLAGYDIPGHTELLARLCRVPDSAMMLYLPAAGPLDPRALGIVHVTLHVSLRQALAGIDSASIVRCGWQLHEIMQRLNRPRASGQLPRLGVCALNPHGGEQGLFGDEELLAIAPAVAELQRRGCNILGPLPADTLLSRAFRGEFDGVVAMYHDQGHIAMKMHHMFDAVNITLGLPIIRTSVAHGTGFDIAGQSKADSRGVLAAARACVILAQGWLEGVA